MIADAGALAACGYQKTSGFLQLIKGFNEESEYVVWEVISGKLSSLRTAWIFERDRITKGLERFQRDLMSGKAHALGWKFKDDDDLRLQQFKALVFGNAGVAGEIDPVAALWNDADMEPQIGDETIIREAMKMFAKYANGDKDAIDPNIRGSVFAIALKYGGEDEVRQVTSPPASVL